LHAWKLGGLFIFTNFIQGAKIDGHTKERGFIFGRF
jgi:hypothetical protein